MNLQCLTIEKIEIEQFKKIRNLTVEPDQGANLFFGSFRSGKTSLCEFVQFSLYGADSVSLARGNAEDAKGRILFSSDKGPFVIERSVIRGKESLLFYRDSREEPVDTTLTPGEYLTGLDQDSFDLINYFRQAKYETPAVKPKFSILNRIASLSADTENIYRDALVLEKKRRLYKNEEKNGSLDLLLAEEEKLEKELSEHPDWEKEAKECLEILDEIREKIDDNDRRCVLLKADMAGFEDDLKLSQNKENAEEVYRKIAAKEKKLKIAAYEVSGKIGKLTEDELEAMKNDYNRLSLAVASLNEARMALSSAEENLAYHETLFTGKNSLENLTEQRAKIRKKKAGRLALCILGILLAAGGTCLAVMLHHLHFDLLTCVASALALSLCGVASVCISTLFTSQIRTILSEYDAEDLAAFYDLFEKASAHSKTTQVYRNEVGAAEENCKKQSAEKDEAQNIIRGKVKALGYRDEDGELLAICDEIIEANDALYDLQAELEEDKAQYRKMLSENVKSENLTLSAEFLSLQKEFTFLSAQNDSLYKKKALVSARLQEAKEKSARGPEEIRQDLDVLSQKLEKEKAEYEGIDLNYTLAKARKDKFEEDLKKALAKQINSRLSFLLGEGESFLFDEDFELCFCDRKSVLPLIAAGGGVISEMGLLSFRLALAELIKTTRLPMIFDDSLAVLTPDSAKDLYEGLKKTCSQFFIATSSEELIEICRDTAKVVIL